MAGPELVARRGLVARLGLEQEQGRGQGAGAGEQEEEAGSKAGRAV